MRSEAPEGVLRGPELAVVDPVRVHVVNLAEVAGIDDLLELRDPRVVLEQVADHENQIGGVPRRCDLGRLA